MEPSPARLHSLLKHGDPVRTTSKYSSFVILMWKSDLSLSLSLAVLSQQMMIMEMFIITIVNYFLYHRRYDPISFEEQDNEKNTNTDLQASLVEHDV